MRTVTKKIDFNPLCREKESFLKATFYKTYAFNTKPLSQAGVMLQQRVTLYSMLLSALQFTLMLVLALLLSPLLVPYCASFVLLQKKVRQNNNAQYFKV